MGILESIYRAVTVPTFNEERLYEQVYEEVSNNQIRTGLWAKALSESYGDEYAAKSIYIKLRVESIKDELISYEKEQYRESKRLEKETKEEQRRAVEARRIAEYRAIHSNVTCKFCGRSQDVKNSELSSKICDYCSNIISKAKHEYLSTSCRNCNVENLHNKTTDIKQILNTVCKACNKSVFKKGIIFKNKLTINFYCKHCNCKNSFMHDSDSSQITCSKCGTRLYPIVYNSISNNNSITEIVKMEFNKRYIIDNHTIIDKSTNLCWTRDINVAGSTVNREQAESKVNRFNTDKVYGITNWRIPSINDITPFRILATELDYTNNGHNLLTKIGFINVDLPYYHWSKVGAISLKSFEKMPGSEFNHLWLVSYN